MITGGRSSGGKHRALPRASQVPGAETAFWESAEREIALLDGSMAISTRLPVSASSSASIAANFAGW
jgi:hypothetical protein